MMKLIVAQKYRHLSRLIVIALSAIALSGTGLSVKGAEVRSGNKTFADWCRGKADLSPETKHTVDVLLKIAETTECDAGDRKLSSLTELSLIDNKISDIKPLASLTNLTGIYLERNQISDIKPLASLTKLDVLDLENNRISDITPLASLTKLDVLDLSGNSIVPKTCPLKPESICTWEPPILLPLMPPSPPPPAPEPFSPVFPQLNN